MLKAIKSEIDEFFNGEQRGEVEVAVGEDVDEAERGLGEVDVIIFRVVIVFIV